MSEAYLMSMPVIINCLGGEMIYILCSRLKAQSISHEKSIRVIKDIGNLLYNKKFQNDLYIRSQIDIKKLKVFLNLWHIHL